MIDPQYKTQITYELCHLSADYDLMNLKKYWKWKRNNDYK